MQKIGRHTWRREWVCGCELYVATVVKSVKHFQTNFTELVDIFPVTKFVGYVELGRCMPYC